MENTITSVDVCIRMTGSGHYKKIHISNSLLRKVDLTNQMKQCNNEGVSNSTQSFIVLWRCTKEKEC